LTYKKKTLHASERNRPDVQEKRRQYPRKVRRIELKRLVFVDETGVNTAMTPTPAWAPRGERAVGLVPTTWGTVSVIAALGLGGVLAPLAFPGATDTAAFQTYVDMVLVPELHAGDVVVFDNLKPHLASGVASAIEHAGAKVLPRRRTARNIPRTRSCGPKPSNISVGKRGGREGLCMTSWEKHWNM